MGSAPSKAQAVDCTIELDAEHENESKIRRHFLCKDGLKELPFPDEPEVNTPAHLFARSVAKFGPLDLLGTREILEDAEERGPYRWMTFDEAAGKVKALGSGLRALGYESGQHVSVFAINREEWTLMLLSIWSQAMTTVPLYDTLGAESVEYIMNHAEIACVCVNRANLAKLLESPERFKNLKHVVVFDPYPEEEKGILAKAGITLLSFAELIELGEKTPVPATMPKPEDLAYVMYTSGTTGKPKGVMLTHRNILASATGLLLQSPVERGEIHISYLPLAHSFEAILQIVALGVGAKIGFFQGNIRKLTDDILALRPTMLAGVPKVYSRIYDKVMNKLEGESWFKKSVFETAFESQLEAVRKGQRSAFWDFLVFNKVKQRLGGRIRLIATGAAPMPKHVYEFLQVCFGCPVMQGYGMTENAAAACTTPREYVGVGTVGGPLPSMEVKLVDIPEMNYTHKDEVGPRGEIWLRGGNVFRGYYKQPEKTAEALTEDGWLKTGDIGRYNADGTLSIIDRKKNVFKLAQGEFVAAEEVESVMSKTAAIAQVFLYGNSFKSSVVAIIVPDREVLIPLAAELGIETPEGDPATADVSALCTNADLIKRVLTDVTATCKAAKLSSFKIPKRIFLEGTIDEEGNGFNVANNCLTPTFKLRRPQLLERYREPIDAMYAELGDISQSEQ